MLPNFPTSQINLAVYSDVGLRAYIPPILSSCFFFISRTFSLLFCSCVFCSARFSPYLCNHMLFSQLYFPHTIIPSEGSYRHNITRVFLKIDTCPRIAILRLGAIRNPNLVHDAKNFINWEQFQVQSVYKTRTPISRESVCPSRLLNFTIELLL